ACETEGHLALVESLNAVLAVPGCPLTAKVGGGRIRVSPLFYGDNIFMSTVLDRPTSAADQLRTTMAAVRVSLKWFGTRKSLTVEQKAEAAESFNAEAKFISAGKKLLDTTHPAYKAVTAVRGKVVAYWK